MTTLLKKNYSKRIIFSPGRQQRFLLKAIENLNLSWASFANKIDVHRRTLNDWKREEYSMPLNIVKEISKVAKVKVPKNTEIKEPFWYVYKGAKIGGIACVKKYGMIGGDPEYRKKKWYEWWEKKGKFINRFLFERNLIKKPKKNINLAEFIGIMLGDGGITPRQIQIDLNKENEKEYQKFINQLIKKLFRINPSIYYRRTSNGIRSVVSSSELIHFCIEKLGLTRGNKVKQQVDIPEWVKQNKSYLTACVRGLMDTEGCVFSHRYKVNGKLYSYKKIVFKNYSYPLIKSVYDFLRSIGLHHPRIAKNLKEVRIESKADVQKYFKLIGFHNPKNLKRYKN